MISTRYTSADCLLKTNLFLQVNQILSPGTLRLRYYIFMYSIERFVKVLCAIHVAFYHFY